MTRRLAAILALPLALLPVAIGPANAAAAQRWLLVSDIHFDPFSNARIAERLAAAPPERWRSVFASAGDDQPYSGYGADTNYPLLEAAIDGMKTENPAPEAIVISGDFLAHGFRDRFNAAVKDRNDAAYDAFVDKTVAFVAGEFRAAFPKARIVPVVGNNDGYCGDYQSTPNSPFLAHMARAFAPAVSADEDGFVRAFSTGGYYTAALPAAGARAVVLNDIYMTRQYANACGQSGDDPAGTELTWLRTVLAATTAPTFVIAHVPPGVDVYSTLHSQPGSVSMMLAPRYNDSLAALLQQYSGHIVIGIMGHAHFNSYRIVGGQSGAGAVGIVVVPAVSPSFGSNPSFAVADVDSGTAAILNEHVFVLEGLSELARNGRKPAHWRREYDFDDAYGSLRVDSTSFQRLQQTLFENGALRRRFESYYDGSSGRAPIVDAVWRAYWCGNVSMTTLDYTACAMPQVQRSLPPQPTAPPLPATSPGATTPAPRAT